MITNLSHDCHLDLCIGNTNEQSHLEYLNLQYLGWNSHLAMFVQIGDCIMHLGGRGNLQLHHRHNHLMQCSTLPTLKSSRLIKEYMEVNIGF